jgi:hypothetical protein
MKSGEDLGQQLACLLKVAEEERQLFSGASTEMKKTEERRNS